MKWNHHVFIKVQVRKLLKQESRRWAFWHTASVCFKLQLWVDNCSQTFMTLNAPLHFKRGLHVWALVPKSVITSLVLNMLQWRQDTAYCQMSWRCRKNSLNAAASVLTATRQRAQTSLLKSRPLPGLWQKKKNTAGKKCANKVSDFTNLPQTIRINDAQTALARILMLLLITANNEINNNYCYSQSPTAAACNLGKCLLWICYFLVWF